MSSPDYHLIYWPGLPGRGEFIRLLFEYTSTPYNDVALTDPGAAVQTITSLRSATDPSQVLALPSGAPSNPAVFAPPVLRHGDLVLSQTPAILQYLAPRLGLAPAAGTAAYHHLHSIVLTLLDGFVAELHDTHHPIAIGGRYEDQKTEALKRGAYFRRERIPAFLAWLERVAAGGEGRWLLGDDLTYADLVLFQCLHGTSFAFPRTMARLREEGSYRAVFALLDAVAAEPKIKSYLESERRQAYGVGIYRHYPEMEDE